VKLLAARATRVSLEQRRAHSIPTHACADGRPRQLAGRHTLAPIIESSVERLDRIAQRRRQVVDALALEALAHGHGQVAVKLKDVDGTAAVGVHGLVDLFGVVLHLGVLE